MSCWALAKRQKAAEKRREYGLLLHQDIAAAMKGSTRASAAELQALSASLVKTMTTPHVQVPSGGHYGYGLHVEKYRGVVLYVRLAARRLWCRGHYSNFVN